MFSGYFALEKILFYPKFSCTEMVVLGIQLLLTETNEVILIANFSSLMFPKEVMDHYLVYCANISLIHTGPFSVLKAVV